MEYAAGLDERKLLPTGSCANTLEHLNE